MAVRKSTPTAPDASTPAVTVPLPPAVETAKRPKPTMYAVGLISEAPFEYITVPTVVLPGNIRGKCVEVPKKTARVRMGAKGVLNHDEGARDGRFELLYPVEVRGFLKYLDTHAFRKTGDYQVPVRTDEGVKMEQHWRAEIEPTDPALSGSVRALHDEAQIQDKTLAHYAWIVEAKLDKMGKPMDMGVQKTVAELRAENGGRFELDDLS